MKLSSGAIRLELNKEIQLLKETFCQVAAMRAGVGQLAQRRPWLFKGIDLREGAKEYSLRCIIRQEQLFNR